MLSPAGIVEAFGDLWLQSELPRVMPPLGLLENGGVVELNLIGVFDEHQGRGYASRALKTLTGR